MVPACQSRSPYYNRWSSQRAEDCLVQAPESTARGLIDTDVVPIYAIFSNDAKPIQKKEEPARAEIDKSTTLREPDLDCANGSWDRDPTPQPDPYWVGLGCCLTAQLRCGHSRSNPHRCWVGQAPIPHVWSPFLRT